MHILNIIDVNNPAASLLFPLFDILDFIKEIKRIKKIHVVFCGDDIGITDNDYKFFMKMYELYKEFLPGGPRLVITNFYHESTPIENFPKFTMKQSKYLFIIRSKVINYYHELREYEDKLNGK